MTKTSTTHRCPAAIVPGDFHAERWPARYAGLPAAIACCRPRGHDGAHFAHYGRPIAAWQDEGAKYMFPDAEWIVEAAHDAYLEMVSTAVANAIGAGLEVGVRLAETETE